MRRFLAKGGYGEHGRSCFLVEYGNDGHFYMVDCGIMDSDPNPYPDVTDAELEKTDYLFLSHCHKDHSGAVNGLLERGFRGVLVAPQITLSLSDIHYGRTVELPAVFSAGAEEIRLDGIELEYGRSGHCPGGLWFLIRDAKGSCFFSGDYQAQALAYACDKVRGKTAELAVIDCAHDETVLQAEALRERLCREVGRLLEEKRSVILPLPHYGRGAGLLLLLRRTFPQSDIRVDTVFASDMEKILQESCWYRERAYQELRELCNGQKDGTVCLNGKTLPPFDLLLLADTHLQKEENRIFAEHAVERGAVLLVTGRVRAGSLPAKLLETGQAKRFLYPHHQSVGDMREMIAENHFQTVLPFHNGAKEILIP